MKLASCKSALNHPVVCSTDRFKAVVPVLVLLFVALWFILRGDLLYVILFLCFSVLLVLRLPRLGKRELILVLFVRLFGLCSFRLICRFPLPLGVWEGLRFVIVALPGLFSYLFFHSDPLSHFVRINMYCYFLEQINVKLLDCVLIGVCAVICFMDAAKLITVFNKTY